MKRSSPRQELSNELLIVVERRRQQTPIDKNTRECLHIILTYCISKSYCKCKYIYYYDYFKI